MILQMAWISLPYVIRIALHRIAGGYNVVQNKGDPYPQIYKEETNVNIQKA